MEPKPDLDLIQEVRNGDRQAFTELMRRYQERVYWVARRIVGSHEDADDVAQETFVKAYVGLGEFRGDARFYTWLYRIAVNLSLNAIRKRQVVQYIQESPIVSRLLLSRDDPHERAVQRDLQTKLEKAVALLPDRQRSVFVLRYFEEMPYEEIAKVLKTSVGGLKANYHHAVKKVQQVLQNEISDHHTDG